jgi:hypothetical protein
MDDVGTNYPLRRCHCMRRCRRVCSGNQQTENDMKLGTGEMQRETQSGWRAYINFDAMLKDFELRVPIPDHTASRFVPQTILSLNDRHILGFHLESLYPFAAFQIFY